MKLVNSRLFGEILADQWALSPEHLEALLDMSQRQVTQAELKGFLQADDNQFKALTSSFGQWVPSTYNAYQRGSTGVMDMRGVLFSRAGMRDYFGFASIEGLSNDFRALDENPNVKDIVILADSPGGSVPGVSDFSAMLKASEKATHIYVVGQLGSAAYWALSGADEIVATNTAVTGSIGVIATVKVKKSGDEETIEIISSNAAKKRLKGKAQMEELQAIVNSMGDLFVEAVADNRGTTVEAVLRDFGQGGVLTAKDAVDVGMIDRISTFQDLMSGIETGGDHKSKRTAASGNQMEVISMDLNEFKSKHPDLYAAVVLEAKNAGTLKGQTEERERVQAHLLMGEASGDMPTCLTAIEKGEGMSILTKAKYESASMKKAQGLAMKADNPDLHVGDGSAPNKDGAGGKGKGKGKEDLGDEIAAILEGEMSYYVDGDGGEA